MRNFLHLIFLLLAFDVWAISLYRVDNNPLDEMNGTGTRKSFITSQGSLSPANPRGHISVLDHIARSRMVEIKSNSQFTSFSSRSDLGGYYGKQGASIITVDLERLSHAIYRGLVTTVTIHSTSKIVDDFENALTKVVKLNTATPEIQTNFRKEVWDHINAYFTMVRTKGVPQSECDTFFWNGVNDFRKRYPSLFNEMSETTYQEYSYIFNGLRHVHTDEEWLVEGVIPKDYIIEKKLPEVAAGMVVSALTGGIERATTSPICD